MKIAVLSPHLQPVPPLTEGGTERIVAYLCEVWKAMGHEVTLFASSDSMVSVTTVSAGSSVLGIKDAPPSLPAAFEAISLDQLRARAGEFDIIHCHTEFSHLAVLAEFQKKVVTTLHWRVDEEDRQSVYRHFNGATLVAISENQKSQLSGGCATVIHHGVPEKLYEMGQGTEGALAFIGRMTDQKRPDRAIEIAQKAGYELVLAGKLDVGNPRYFTEKVEPNLSERTRWIGAIDDSQKKLLLQDSAALLFPIDWDEPFGLVMIEAMACGCPVIAWRRGSVPEVIEDGVTGFVVDSIDEAVAAVGKLSELDRTVIRSRFEARFTSYRMAQDYIEYFQTLVCAK